MQTLNQPTTQTHENAPVSVPAEKGITIPTEAQNAPEGEKSGDTATEAQKPSATDAKATLFDAHSPYEKAIAEYLEANASAQLRAKIAEAKTHGYGIAQCFAYITSEAHKLAKGNCAMVEDATVYGWAVHYFEDEWQADLTRKEAEAAKRELEERAKTEAEAAEALAKEDEQRAKAEADAARRAKAEAAAAKKAERDAKAAAKAAADAAQGDLFAGFAN